MKSGRIWWIAGLAVLGAAALWWAKNPRRGSTPAPASAEPAPEPAREAAARTTPTPPPTPPPAAAKARPPEPPPPPPPDAAAAEARAVAEIRAIVREDPRRALALIDTADRAYPTGTLAEERAALRVDALVGTDQVGHARQHAEEFMQRYPDSRFTEHLERLTGIHPRPTPP